MAETTTISDIRKDLDGRIMGMRQDRYSWWVHWRELADYILPRRYKWLITPNQWNRGAPINGYIIDSTGTLAARNCASGMMTGITSPTRPWFHLKIEGFDEEGSAVVRWLAEVERRMMAVFQESNFYTSVGTMYFDLVVFGSAPMLIYEDYDSVVRFYNPCAGEYYLYVDGELRVTGFAREFVMTIQAAVREFGIDNVSESVRVSYRTGGAAWTREIKIAHMIEKNDPKMPGIGANFEWREIYWEWGSQNDSLLRKRGYHESPFIAPRWDIVSNDAYGRSPAMDALGDIKQLQQETKRKAQAIDKMVNPPLMADIQMKNQPASVIPGGVSYVTNLAVNPGMKPVYQVTPQIEHMMKDIMEIQGRIKSTFFNDLFLMISQLETVRTATEIDARREEKLVMLGPVLERLQNESGDPTIDRVFNVMNRAKLFPPAPEEVQGQPIMVEYVSMLAEAQRAAATSGMERLMAQLGNIAAIRPDVLDNIDFNEYTDEYAEILHVPPRIIVPKEQVEALQANRAQQQAQQQKLVAAAEVAKGAKTLSETNVGGGASTVLDQMLGGGAQ